MWQHERFDGTVSDMDSGPPASLCQEIPCNEERNCSTRVGGV